MKRVIPVLVGALLGVGFTIGLLYIVLDKVMGPLPDPPMPTPALPQILATVNGEAITREMVEAEIKISRLNVIDPMPPLGDDDLFRATQEALNQLVTRHLILQTAAGQGFRLDDAFIEDRVDLLFGSYGDQALADALTDAGATRDDLTWWVREIFTVEEFTTQVIMAGAVPDQRQQVYNNWLNAQRATADVKTFLTNEPQAPQALMGKTAPNFTLTALNGQPVSLSDYHGRVVLLNFWATWCSSCLTEMPAYEQIYQQVGPDKFMVLGINYQEDVDQVAPYAAGLGLTFPVLLDQNGTVTTQQYQAIGMPASFIINRDGQIFYRHLGPMNSETLQVKLAELGL